MAAVRRLSTAPSPPRYTASAFSLAPTRFGQPAGQQEAERLASARLVVFGEIHEVPPCIQMQRRTAEAMLDAGESAGQGTLHILLEHFNFEQQHLLNGYTSESLSLHELVAQYEQQGEGHDLFAYEPLLALARERPGHVMLHAGFIPREFARIVMRESLDAALAAARAKGYVAEEERCDATEAHYSFFESLLTGRDPNDASTPPTDKFRRMFPAQVIKDAAMAHRVAQLASASGGADRFLVVCGVGHSGYSHGVPERVLAAQPQLADSMFRIWSLPADPQLPLGDSEAVGATLRAHFGAPGVSDPADLVLVFQQHEASDDAGAMDGAATDGAADGMVAKDDAEAVKAATAAAYNAVGETAHLRGDAARATALLRRMQYTEAEIALAGADVANWQGVGCPHRLAQLRRGERVVDLGCGLGIDSFIAAAAVGGSGSVRGVDIAANEVRHANARAAARGIDAVARFDVGDLEALPLPDGCADVIISNGALCLAPNKPAAFREAHRVLRPGGRLAVALSVTRPAGGLEPGVQWPLCMRMFIELDELAPVCAAAGFEQVAVDQSDSLMAFDLDYEPETAAEDVAAAGAAERQQEQQMQTERNKVHVGSPEFRHLRNYDVNALCARVVVTAVKAS